MDVAKQREIVDALTACPSMGSEPRRDAVVEELREGIRSAIDRSASGRDDVTAIVRACLQFFNGLEELVVAVRARDGDSLPMQNLDRVILRVFGFDLAEEEMGLRLLSVLAGIQAAPDDLQRTYRRLLPPDVAPSPDARGLFSVLPHLWRISRELATQSRTGNVPILDFVEQLAREAPGSVAGQLRGWATEVTSLVLSTGPAERPAEMVMRGTGTGDGGVSALDPRLAILASVFAALYPTIEVSGELVAAARLNPVGIEFRELPSLNWHNILTAAARRDRVSHLVEAALTDQPENPWLKVALDEQQTAYMPRVRPSDAASPAAQLSPAVGNPLPAWPQHVSFLQEGLDRAQAVLLIQLPGGGSGTGFLVRGNLLVTGGYIISTADEARQAVVRCNFQRTMGALMTTPEELRLAPDEGFATTEDGIWTAVRVAGKPTERMGYLSLEPATPQLNDRVSLIHHTGGGPKQLELLNRLVIDIAPAIIQYNTENPLHSIKQPGSGGAPVFDVNWRVVGMHRAHGMLQGLSDGERRFCGEGVHINVIIEGLKAAGLYVGRGEGEIP
jgi:hypothetical protein